ncbi:hypothetical protein HDU93_007285 [Gonapodya sp. JEL0774]|nr:hypothetical protein HDU93_007285 [Gonapodya sp. JEL0774]
MGYIPWLRSQVHFHLHNPLALAALASAAASGGAAGGPGGQAGVIAAASGAGAANAAVASTVLTPAGGSAGGEKSDASLLQPPTPTFRRTLSVEKLSIACLPSTSLPYTLLRNFYEAHKDAGQIGVGHGRRVGAKMSQSPLTPTILAAAAPTPTEVSSVSEASPSPPSSSPITLDPFADREPVAYSEAGTDSEIERSSSWPPQSPTSTPATPILPGRELPLGFGGIVEDVGRAGSALYDANVGDGDEKWIEGGTGVFSDGNAKSSEPGSSSSESRPQLHPRNSPCSSTSNVPGLTSLQAYPPRPAPKAPPFSPSFLPAEPAPFPTPNGTAHPHPPENPSKPPPRSASVGAMRGGAVDWAGNFAGAVHINSAANGDLRVGWKEKGKEVVRKRDDERGKQNTLASPVQLQVGDRAQAGFWEGKPSIGRLLRELPPGYLSHFVDYFGPQVFLIWKYALTRKRIIFYADPPVLTMVHRVVAAIMLTTHLLPDSPDSFSFASSARAQAATETFLPSDSHHPEISNSTASEPSPLPSQLQLPVFYVNVNDIPHLQHLSRSRRGFVACTTESIFRQKTDLWDLWVEYGIVVPNELGAVRASRGRAPGRQRSRKQSPGVGAQGTEQRAASVDRGPTAVGPEKLSVMFPLTPADRTRYTALRRSIQELEREENGFRRRTSRTPDGRSSSSSARIQGADVAAVERLHKAADDYGEEDDVGWPVPSEEKAFLFRRSLSASDLDSKVRISGVSSAGRNSFGGQSVSGRSSIGGRSSMEPRSSGQHDWEREMTPWEEDADEYAGLLGGDDERSERWESGGRRKAGGGRQSPDFGIVSNFSEVNTERRADRLVARYFCALNTQILQTLLLSSSAGTPVTPHTLRELGLDSSHDFDFLDEVAKTNADLYEVEFSRKKGGLWGAITGLIDSRHQASIRDGVTRAADTAVEVGEAIGGGMTRGWGACSNVLGSCLTCIERFGRREDGGIRL